MESASKHMLVMVIDERNPDLSLSTRWMCLQAHELTQEERDEISVCGRIARHRAERKRLEFLPISNHFR